MRTLDLSDYHAASDPERFRQILQDAISQPGTHVHIPPGTYTLTADLARDTMQKAVSGAYGDNPEPVMFRPDFPYSVGLDFSNHRGTVLEAEGVFLIIDGFMEPVCLKDCSGITVHGLTIDYLRKPYSRGTILSCEKESGRDSGSLTVRFGDAFPVGPHVSMHRHCVYDLRRERFLYGIRLTRRQYLGNQTFRFQAACLPEHDLAGNEFYIWHSFHFRPAILIENASDILLQNVTIHAQPGMGIVGHRSRNIRMDHLQVIPSPGEHMSTNTDATHFTSCTGDLIFQDCVFEGHGDDATNVHTFYHDISDAHGTVCTGTVPVRTHSLTLDYPDPGDVLELVEKKSMRVRSVFRVMEVRPDFSLLKYTVRLDSCLPDDAAENCYLSNTSQIPRVQFLHCHTRNHWARAVLLKTRHALIEDCLFQTSALQAIHIAPEESWHEGISSEDIVIRRCQFIDCGLGLHAETGGIRIEVASDRPEGTPQKNILIEHNLFDLPETGCAVTVSHAQDVMIRENEFRHCASPVQIQNSTRVEIEPLPCPSAPPDGGPGSTQ